MNQGSNICATYSYTSYVMIMYVMISTHTFMLVDNMKIIIIIMKINSSLLFTFIFLKI